jgi:hypothetical protein
MPAAGAFDHRPFPPFQAMLNQRRPFTFLKRCTDGRTEFTIFAYAPAVSTAEPDRSPEHQQSRVTPICAREPCGALAQQCRQLIVTLCTQSVPMQRPAVRRVDTEPAQQREERRGRRRSRRRGNPCLALQPKHFRHHFDAQSRRAWCAVMLKCVGDQLQLRIVTSRRLEAIFELLNAGGERGVRSHCTRPWQVNGAESAEPSS